MRSNVDQYVLDCRHVSWLISKVIRACLHVLLTQNLIFNKLTKYFRGVLFVTRNLREFLYYGIEVGPGTSHDIDLGGHYDETCN